MLKSDHCGGGGKKGGEPPGLVVNAEDVGSNPSFTKKNLNGYDGPLDGRKTNENNWGKSRQKNI